MGTASRAGVRWDPREHLGFPDVLTASIEGEWAEDESDAELLSVEDPASEQEIAVVREASDELVDRAVRSADSAFRGVWRQTDGIHRGRIMMSIAARIRAESEWLSMLESLDTGKPLSQARGDVEESARYFEFFAGAADKLYGSTLPRDSSTWAYTLREPYGVVAHVTPWNSPLSQMCRGVAPCLAAGNTVVVKPSEVTPLSSLMMAKLFMDAGLPAGVCNIVPGRGATTGAALVGHPLVRYVAFTGSIATGKAIMHLSAERIVGCSLELGGKSPTIVMPDADLEAAALAGALAVVRNAGQSCMATTRLLVHRSVLDEVVERAGAAMARLRVGHGLDDPDLGPVSSKVQLEKVRGFLDGAVADGAEVAVGGNGRGEFGVGHFIRPTLLVNVTQDMRIAREEVFGPVQSVIGFSDEDEAVHIANDTEYGLAAGVFTRDLSTAHRLAGRLEAGQVLINRYPAGGVDTPFGGYKQSGLGREKGLEALAHYTQNKTVIVQR